MKKTIYQLACLLQEENDTYAISTENFKEDTELVILTLFYAKNLPILLGAKLQK
jgi:hypothetical protein